mmetsp:Transcript_110192/g.235257  ORF Transcript_110192/g.235257 Transcript_110192/m.235257 type:complete len:219 (+) Transcript_110192:223-879(+)
MSTRTTWRRISGRRSEQEGRCRLPGVVPRPLCGTIRCGSSAATPRRTASISTTCTSMTSGPASGAQFTPWGRRLRSEPTTAWCSFATPCSSSGASMATTGSMTSESSTSVKSAGAKSTRCAIRCRGASSVTLRWSTAIPCTSSAVGMGTTSSRSCLSTTSLRTCGCRYNPVGPHRGRATATQRWSAQTRCSSLVAWTRPSTASQTSMSTTSHTVIGPR